MLAPSLEAIAQEAIAQEDRLLAPGDEHNLERFLSARADSALLMLSNLRASGLTDRGEAYQGSYAAHLTDGAVDGVVAHYWNGMALLQAPEGCDRLIELALRRSGRALTGLLGPAEQVTGATAALGLTPADIRLDSPHRLHVLDLARLVVPAALSSGEVRCRRPRSSELDLLMNWRVAQLVTNMGAEDTAEAHAEARRTEQAHFDQRTLWVLERQGRLVSTCSIIGRTERALQIGGVWTPERYRGRGFARAVVAGALTAERQAGRSRACLITASPAAERAYRALGFEGRQDIGLVLLNGER